MFGPIMRFWVGEYQIELAPIEREDMPQFVQGGGLQSYVVSRYLGSSGFAPVLADEYEWFDKVRSEQASRAWGIYVLNGGQRMLIGNTSINNITEGVMSHGCTGFLIFRPEYWGKGIASHCHRVRAWFACTQMGLVQLRSAVYEGNEGSRKALERIGYVPIFHERNRHFVDGKYIGITSFSLINPLSAQWNLWWHGDAIPPEFQTARRRTRAALKWAEANLELG